MPTKWPEGDDSLDRLKCDADPIDGATIDHIIERALLHTQALLDDRRVDLPSAVAGLEKIEATLARAAPDRLSLAKLRARIRYYKSK